MPVSSRIRQSGLREQTMTRLPPWRRTRLMLASRVQVGQVLALVRSKAGDVDEPDYVVGRAGGGDDGAAIGVSDQQNRSVDFLDHAFEVLAVAAGQPAQRVRRGDHRGLFAEKLVVKTTEARCVSKRAVDEDDGGIGISHGDYLFPVDGNAQICDLAITRVLLGVSASRP